MEDLKFPASLNLLSTIMMYEYIKKLLKYKLSVTALKYFHFILLQHIIPVAASYYAADMTASDGQNVANR